MGTNRQMAARKNWQCDQKSLEFNNQEKTKADWKSKWSFRWWGPNKSQIEFYDSSKVEITLMENKFNSWRLLYQENIWLK
jgi:hypothetical protein